MRYIVGFSFTKGAYEEAARAKTKNGMDIQLVEVKDLLADSSELVTPVSGRLFGDLPLPKGADSKPSADELIASDKSDPVIEETDGDAPMG